MFSSKRPSLDEIRGFWLFRLKTSQLGEKVQNLGYLDQKCHILKSNVAFGTFRSKILHLGTKFWIWAEEMQIPHLGQSSLFSYD